MTNSERLEELETKYSTLTVSSEKNGMEYTEVDVKDLVFLIQNVFKQAERVEELEKENQKLNFEIGSYSLQISEILRCLDKEVEDLKKLSSHMLRGSQK